MTEGDREGLTARIRQVRRLAATRSRADASRPAAREADPVRDLQTRVAHLEQLVQGLQDSVYRESERHAKLIGDLQAQIEPAAMSAALAEDARQRGI